MTVGPQFTVVSTEAEIRSILPEWSRLAQRAAHSPFELPEVALLLHRLTQPQGSPWIACVAAPDGTLAAVLPLRRVLGTGWLTRRVLQPLAGWHTSHFSGLESPEAEGSLLRLFGELSSQRTWDLCDLRFLPANSPLLDLPGAVKQRVDNAHRFTATGGGAPVIAPSRAVPKRRRRLERLGAIVVCPAEPPQHLEEAVTALAAMHTERWRATPSAQEFASESGRGALLELLSQPALREVARISTLRLDGTIIAAMVSFRWKGVEWLWRLAHHSAWEEYSPGIVLYEAMLQEALEAGCQRIELGRGDAPFKLRGRPASYPLYRLSIRSRSWRSRFTTLLTGPLRIPPPTSGEDLTIPVRHTTPMGQ